MSDKQTLLTKLDRWIYNYRNNYNVKAMNGEYVLDKLERVLIKWRQELDCRSLTADEQKIDMLMDYLNIEFVETPASIKIAKKNESEESN